MERELFTIPLVVSSKNCFLGHQRSQGMNNGVMVSVESIEYQQNVGIGERENPQKSPALSNELFSQ